MDPAPDRTPSARPSVGGALRRRAAAIRDAWPVESRSIVRIVVAAAVSWQVCVALGATQPPVYAVIVPLVAVRDAPYSAFDVSFARIVGVVAGLGIGVGVLAVLRPGVLAVSVVLALALVAAIALRAGNTLNVQVAVSALLVFASTTPSSYAVTRLWETAVGAVVTVVLAPLLLPTDPVRTFLADRVRVTAGLATTLRAAGGLAALDARSAEPELARLSAAARGIETDARALGPNLVAARRAVRLSPVWRWRPQRLPEPAAVDPLVPDLAAMTRLLVDDLWELAERSDTRDWWSARGSNTSDVAAPVAVALAAQLADQPDHDAEDRAWAALHRDMDIDGSRFGVVVRRPLCRILELLENGRSGR